MSTDFRALCARMADELDHYRQLLMDDRRATHALAAEARAALAEGAGVGVADEELLELSAHHGVSYTMSTGEVIYPMQEGCDMRDDVLSFARAILARFGTTHPRPIPVAERLPTEADCDAGGRCWWFHPGCEVTTPFWYLADCEYPDRATPYDPSAWLPAAAIPLPSDVTHTDPG